jgi:ABC-type spermidine/putrescine transport system permease subunit II
VLTVAVCSLFAALGVFIIWPVWANGLEALSGLCALADQGNLTSRFQQITYSIFAATVASVAALQLAIGVRALGRPWLTVLAVAPGLCGSLVISLTLLAVFQVPLLNAVYDSWLPMIVASILLMLPRALLLVVLLEVLSPRTSIHSAGLLRAAGGAAAVHGRNLIWQLDRIRWLIASAVLAHWCLWDVAVASTLRPVRFEPIVVRLYNEMHYGRTETLVAITLLALVIPLGLICIAAVVWKRLPEINHP